MQPNQHLSDSADHPAEAEPRGLPYLPVGLGIFALLVVILIAALLLNGRFRPPVGVATVPAIAGQSSVTPPPMPSPTAPAVVPAITPSPSAPSAAATATPPLGSPTPPPAATASAAGTAITPTLTASEATAVALGIPLTLQTPVVEPGTTGSIQELEKEIRAAYLHYWDVRAEAYLNLDTSHLSEVMAGAELERETQQLQDRIAKNKPSRLDVEHHISFVLIGDDRAIINDQYLNKSVFVDPATKHDIPTAEPPSIVKVSFQLRKLDGVWKVVDGNRYE